MARATVAHYDAQYGQFATRLYAEIRAEAFGEDIGQNGWLTRNEHDLFIQWLALDAGSRLLDVASGAGATTLRIARLTGCAVQGVDVHAQGVAVANAAAAKAGLSERATFLHADANEPLPFEDASFDAVLCIDAINHFVDRPAVFREWARLLRPGGRLVFTDPIVVTGPLTNEEIAIRSSIGFFLFVPPGYDERTLADSGFEAIAGVDRTHNMAEMARRWREARARRAAALAEIEGVETFEGQQRFLDVAARLAGDRRLSRYALRAERRGA